MNENTDAQKVADVLAWLARHPFATMDELVAAKRVHGVGSYWEFNRLDQAIQSACQKEPYRSACVAVVLQQVYDPSGRMHHLWSLSASPAAAEVYTDYLRKQAFTRILNLSGKRAVDIMALKGDQRQVKRSEAIIELAMQVADAQMRWRLAGETEDESPADKVAWDDVARARASWGARELVS